MFIEDACRFPPMAWRIASRSSETAFVVVESVVALLELTIAVTSVR